MDQKVDAAPAVAQGKGGIPASSVTSTSIRMSEPTEAASGSTPLANASP